jgi:hypothetical protein
MVLSGSDCTDYSYTDERSVSDFQWKNRKEKHLQTSALQYSFFMGISFSRSWGSSVSIVADYGLDDRGSIPDRGRGFFF